MEGSDVELVYPSAMGTSGRAGSTVAIVILTVIAGGAGYAAYHLRGEAHGVKNQLEIVRTEQRNTTDALEKEKKSTETTQGKLADCATALEAEKSNREQTEKLATDTAAHLDATKSELEELRKEHAENEKRLATFKSITDKLSKMIDAGKIQVTVRGGRMFVKLPAEVLFHSGSAELSPDGKPSLGEIAGVLKQFPDRKFMVAGHTDNVPVTDKKFSNNWELSTARALTVTQFLIEKGVKPTSLVAAGYGEFDPTHSNAGEAGRKENRRIEIVLLPNIGSLPRIPAEPAASAQPPAAKPGK